MQFHGAGSKGAVKGTVEDGTIPALSACGFGQSVFSGDACHTWQSKMCDIFGMAYRRQGRQDMILRNTLPMNSDDMNRKEKFEAKYNFSMVNELLRFAETNLEVPCGRESEGYDWESQEPGVIHL